MIKCMQATTATPVVIGDCTYQLGVPCPINDQGLITDQTQINDVIAALFDGRLQAYDENENVLAPQAAVTAFNLHINKHPSTKEGCLERVDQPGFFEPAQNDLEYWTTLPGRGRVKYKKTATSGTVVEGPTTALHKSRAKIRVGDIEYVRDGNSTYATRNLASGDIDAVVESEATLRELEIWYETPSESSGLSHFTIAFIPDTQQYVDADNENMNPFEDIITDIIARKDIDNIIHVGTLGDNVETYTNNAEWALVTAQYDRLAAAGISYSITGGNHDSNGRDMTQLNTHFPPADFSSAAKFVEFMDPTDSTNTAWNVSFNGCKVLFLNVEMGFSALTGNWIKDLSERFFDHVVIVATHALVRPNPTTGVSEILPSGGSGDPTNYGFDGAQDCEDMWAFLQTIPNIAFIMCGHRGIAGDGAATISVAGPSGWDITATMINDQYLMPVSNRGHYHLRRFNLNTETVDAITYNPNLDSYDTSSDAEFTISDLPFKGSGLSSDTYPRVDTFNVAETPEENIATGALQRSPSDLELGADGANPQLVAFRFPVDVLKGATINSAYLELVAEENTHTDDTDLIIRTEDAGNSVEFPNESYAISARTLSAASVAWDNVPVWTTIGESHNTPDITTLIQNLVDKPTWNKGNYLSIVISGTGRRNAYSAAGGANAPKLVIDWSFSY